MGNDIVLEEFNEEEFKSLVPETRLARCPFCKDGGKPWLPAPGEAVRCSKCGAEGSLTRDPELAVKLWNERG